MRSASLPLGFSINRDSPLLQQPFRDIAVVLVVFTPPLQRLRGRTSLRIQSELLDLLFERGWQP
jgi:hypothetical protein